MYQLQSYKYSCDNLKCVKVGSVLQLKSDIFAHEPDHLQALSLFLVAAIGVRLMALNLIRKKPISVAGIGVQYLSRTLLSKKISKCFKTILACVLLNISWLVHSVRLSMKLAVIC